MFYVGPRISARDREPGKANNFSGIIDPGCFAVRVLYKRRCGQVNELCTVPQERVEQRISRQVRPADHFASFVETVHRRRGCTSKAAEVLHPLPLLPKEWMVGGEAGIRIRR